MIEFFTFVLLTYPWIVPTLLTLLAGFLVRPAQGSGLQLLWAIFLSWIILIWPLMGFAITIVFDASWVGAAKHGWLDTWHSGKIWLLPLLLWGLCALLVYENRHKGGRPRVWISAGIAVGTLVTTLTYVHLVFLSSRLPVIVVLIHLYLPGWFWWRTVTIVRQGYFTRRLAGWTMLIALPFHVLSVRLAQINYWNLPGKPPDCFVATAAARGHRWIVGPYVETATERPVTVQLATLRRFEILWADRMPASHKWFRGYYNVWGYRASLLVRTPWMADLVYLCLKPAQWLAALLLLISRVKAVKA